jgi:hypothetical protein
MWRWLAVAAALYGFGDPQFEAYRPAAFERSLREFHRDVDRMTAGTLHAFVMFDQARSLRSLTTLTAQFQAMLSGR